MNKALAFNEMGKRDEAIAVLGTLATDAAQPTDIEQLAVFSLASITREPWSRRYRSATPCTDGHARSAPRTSLACPLVNRIT
jgi:hypothetical protein